MPPRTRITRDMIISAAFDIVRSGGIEALTARSIAQRLNCSTQPILYCFSSIDEIKREVYEIADRFHSEYIMPSGRRTMNPLLETGMNYVRFGHEEKPLFRFLFQSNQFSGMNLEQLVQNPEPGAILSIAAAQSGMDTEALKELFLSLFITAHGCASLLAGNAMEYEEERIKKLLTAAFRGAVGQGGE